MHRAWGQLQGQNRFAQLNQAEALQLQQHACWLAEWGLGGLCLGHWSLGLGALRQLLLLRWLQLPLQSLQPAVL